MTGPPFKTRSYGTGRLTSDARLFDGKNGKVARFSIAHNFGKGMPVLFADAVMFTTKDCTIPEDILVKGTIVAISDVTTGTERFETVDMYSNYFRNMSYTPAKEAI